MAAIYGRAGVKHEYLREIVLKALIYVILISGVLAVIFPFLWMISASLKDLKDVFGFPVQWIPEKPRWSNYKEVLDSGFMAYFLNSVKLAGLTTAFQVMTGSLAAYSLTKLNFPGKDKIFLAYMSTIMLPTQSILIPQFMVMKKLNLVNNHWSIILICAFSPFAVFMMKQFFITIPNELVESGRIDGCSEFRIFLQIIMPVAKPVLATLTTLVLMWSWNDLMYPLIYLFKKSLYTLPRGLLALCQSREYQQQYNLLMAGTCLSLIPILLSYMFAQKYFIEGIVAGALKG